MRFGVLQAGRVPPPLDTYGDYTHMFQGLLRQVASDVEIQRYEITLGEHPERTDECDAWIISGSVHGVHDDFDWLHQLEDFVSNLLAQERKTIGICFGHQLIAKLEGGEVEKAKIGWCAGVTHYLDETSGHNGERQLRLIASHQDQVVRMPNDANLKLSAPNCPIAGFSLGDHVITVQGHPEFTPDFARALYAVRRKVLGEAGYKQAIASLDLPLDSLEVAEEIMSFVHDR